MFAFVLMPFDEKFGDVYKLGIKDTCEKLGIKAERVDEQIFHKEDILERIYAQIEAADFIIADMTGRNPNVFYEVGYAQGKAKLCLLITSAADDIPFDLKHHRHLVYGNSIDNLRQSLERDLVAINTEVTNRRSVLTLKLVNPSATLKKSTFAARAEVSLIFDLNNRTTTPSPEIDAIYFYTGRGWTFKQDGQLCGSKETAGADFPLQHFVKPPVRRLGSGAWAQIRLEGEKYLAFASEDQPLADSYKLTGRAKITVVTPTLSLDYPIEIDVTADEFPF